MRARDGPGYGKEGKLKKSQRKTAQAAKPSERSSWGKVEEA